MAGASPRHPGLPDNTAEEHPPETFRDLEGRHRPASFSAPLTIEGVGSLPERFSWQAFQPQSHGYGVTHCAPPLARISGSLGNTSLTVEAMERVRPYLCSPMTRSYHPPPCFPSPHAQIGFHPPHTHTMSRSREFDTFLCSSHQPMACCSQPRAIPLCRGAAQGQGENDETTPLLTSKNRQEHGYKSVGGAKEESSGARMRSRRRPSFRRFTRKQLLTLCSMLAVVITSFASLSVMAPFLPRQMARMELSKTVCGMIFSIYPCMMVLASPVIGKLMPLFESRVVYLLGITLAGVANMLFGLVGFIDGVSVFLAVSIVLRVLAALGTSCFLTIIYALVPIVFPDDVNVVTGMLETVIGMGMCLGPALGMWLYSMGGFPMPFFGLGAIILLTMIINCFTFPDDELLIVSNHGTGGVLSVVSHPRVGLSLFILCVTGACLSTLFPTLQPHMHKLGVSTRGVCMIYLVLSAMYAVSAPLVGLAIDRYGGMDTFMLLGLLLTALSLILIGNSPLLPPPPSHQELYVQDIIGMVVFGVSSAMCIVPTFSSIIKAAASTGEVDMGTYSIIGGIWSSAYSLGEVLGPLGAGLLAEHTTFASTTTVIALIPVALAVMFGTYLCASRGSTVSTSSP
ncbi:hypothetical protein O3P69_009007 [Scylla paramamosain]|uniref:Major facilitator superfamily (MFS) profile domain-containing protein n=1 Tax=Scylla paramamosain TaxID=85552 RepID=A0AAW0TQX5_SCYPA